MERSLVERRLGQVGSRMKGLRSELAILDEQRVQVIDEAEDARIRALVSETPISNKVHRTANRHVEVIERRRREITRDIAKLEGIQDELLDRLVAERR